MKNATKPYINGQLAKQTHSATIRAVLYDHDNIPPVFSRGRDFYNSDSWTLRIFCAQMCEWASRNKGLIPTKDDIRAWVRHANNKVGTITRQIVIASTDDNLSRKAFKTLVGGGYHEAWHTRYTIRGRLSEKVIIPNVLKRWALIENWAPFHEELQKWNNVVEDIRIERVGNDEFPSARPALVDLQDFILDLESKGLESARHHTGNKELTRNALSVVTSTFRDVGLGYMESSKQREALVAYQKENPEAFGFVKDKLGDLIDKAISLSADDNYDCLWISMDVIIRLVEASQQESEGDDGQEGEEGGDEGDDSQDGDCQDGQQGDGKGQPKNQEVKCPKCGADHTKLRIRKGKSKKTYFVCTACGYQEEINPSQVKHMNQEQAQQSGGQAIQYEDLSGDGQDDQDQQGSGSQQGSQQQGGNQNGQGDSNQVTIYSVGDTAMLDGQEVRVTRAGNPNENGIQDLEVEPI